MNQTPALSREGTASFLNGEQVDFRRSSEHVQAASEYYHETEESRARKEALGAAAFAKTPIEKERLSELAVEGIARSGAWIEYARKDYRDRYWNLEDREAA